MTFDQWWDDIGHRKGHIMSTLFQQTAADLAAECVRLQGINNDLLEALRQAESTLRRAAQESAGKVRREVVGGWIHHANKARAAFAKATS